MIAVTGCRISRFSFHVVDRVLVTNTRGGAMIRRAAAVTLSVLRNVVAEAAAPNYLAAS